MCHISVIIVSLKYISIECHNCNIYMSFTETRKKEAIHATVSPYIKKKADELVAKKDFSSMSDLVNTALTEFIVKYVQEKKITAAKKGESINEGDEQLLTILRMIEASPEFRKKVIELSRNQENLGLTKEVVIE